MRVSSAIATLGLLAALAVGGGRSHAAPPPGAEEGKARARIAQGFVEAGAWLAERGRKAEAARAVAEAREADPKAAGLEALAGKVEGLGEAEGADAAAAERWTKAAQEAAKAYEKLGTAEHDAKDDARFDGWVLKALELDP